MKINSGLRTWIEVRKSDLRNNYLTFRRLLKSKTKLMAIAKSNAYGHGLIDYALFMESLGIDWFGVDSIVEARTLRENGIKKPILVLGYTLPEKITEAFSNKISLTVSSFEALQELTKMFPAVPKIHLKIDTGMHRQGFFIKELPKTLNFIERKMNLGIIEGVYTHFAGAKDPKQPQETLKQIEEFESAIKILKGAGINAMKHAAATAGTINFPKSHYDMVRVGIGLYGLWPSPETFQSFRGLVSLKPALVWKTIVSEVKILPKNSKIGYDFTETLTRDSKIAVCPIGYWHGFPRALSSKGYVVIKNKACKVLGRVSMDMISVDVTEVEGVKIGNIVTILGGQEQVPPAEGLAGLCGTTNYEIITRLNPLIKRFYIGKA